MTEPDDPAASRVLVDSSIWIDYYRPDGAREARAAVSAALAADRVYTTPLIVAEVVQGAPDDEALDALARDFSALRPIGPSVDVGASAARIGYALRRRGRQVPATDLLIAASALDADCELWHRDAHFEAVARVTALRERSF